MLGINSLRILFKGIRSVVRINKNNYFSPAFTCESAWNKRLETPLLKKCVLEDLYYDLETKYGQSECINAIDVDIFVNAIKDSSHLDEMQDLVHKLRLSSEACNILDSTHHAFIRTLLDYNKHNELVAALNDRLNYGIFPDDYSILLMLDRFIKVKDYKNAAKVSTMYMLQEDFKNNLINYLSLYACHQYLLNPTEWENAVEAEPEDDEVIKVRVNYIRNPYFDEHFDLTKSNDLIGKTFMLIGKELNNEIGSSYELLGYILFNKLTEAENYLQTTIQNKKQLHKDIDLAMKYLDEMKENEKAESTKSLCQNLVSNNLVKETDALTTLDSTIKDLVDKTESQLINQQENTFNQWIETRDQVLKESLNKVKTEERLSAVRRMREELAKKEQELFFFEREDQLDLEIERKQMQAEEDNAGVQTHKSKTSDDDYKPPEIVKQRHRN